MSDQLPHDEELRALYRKLPADEPRSEIDNAILAAAREQIHQKQRRRFFTRLGWTVPLAAAASIAVTFTLIHVAPQESAMPTARVDDSNWSAQSRFRSPSASLRMYVDSKQQAKEDERKEQAVRSALPLPPEEQNAPAREIDDAARQKLQSLGYIGKDQGVASNESARDDERSDAPSSPPAAAEPADTANGSGDSSDGWRNLGTGRSLESQFGVSRRGARVVPDEARKAKEANAAPAPATERDIGAAPAPAEKKAPAAVPPSSAPKLSDSVTMRVGPLAKAEAEAKDTRAALKAAPPPPPPPAPATPPVLAQSGSAPAPPADSLARTNLPPAESGKAEEADAKPEVQAELHNSEIAADKEDAPTPGNLARNSIDVTDLDSARARQEAAQPPAGAVAPVVPAAWPFQLEAGLDKHESCERVVRTLKSRCELSHDTATVALKTPQKISTGEFAGAKVSRVRLIFKNGKLWSVSLMLEGYETEQVLVAPPKPQE